VNASILASTFRDVLVDSRFGALIANNSIPNAKLQLITPDKIRTESLSGGAGGLSLSRQGQIAAYSINNYNLENDAVDSRTILNGQVTPVKLSTGAPTWNSSGLLTVADASITNLTVNKSKTSQAIEFKQSVAISSGNVSLNLGQASLFVVNKNDAISSWTFANVPANDEVCVFILQLVAAGNTTIAWPPGTRWPAGISPFLSTTAGKVDTFGLLTHDGGSNWFGFILSQNA
jgi:hypothetical protein